MLQLPPPAGKNFANPSQHYITDIILVRIPAKMHQTSSKRQMEHAIELHYTQPKSHMLISRTIAAVILPMMMDQKLAPCTDSAYSPATRVLTWPSPWRCKLLQKLPASPPGITHACASLYAVEYSAGVMTYVYAAAEAADLAQELTLA